MSIYSVAFEVGHADGLKVGRMEGHREGHREGHMKGRMEGRMEGLTQGQIGLICKKLQKGKSLETIADELEENVDAIHPIFEFAASFAPEYDPEKVLEAWFQQNNSNN